MMAMFGAFLSSACWQRSTRLGIKRWLCSGTLRCESEDRVRATSQHSRKRERDGRQSKRCGYLFGAADPASRLLPCPLAANALILYFERRYSVHSPCALCCRRASRIAIIWESLNATSTPGFYEHTTPASRTVLIGNSKPAAPDR